MRPDQYCVAFACFNSKVFFACADHAQFFQALNFLPVVNKRPQGNHALVFGAFFSHLDSPFYSRAKTRFFG
jgi:hypothetical protein